MSSYKLTDQQSSELVKCATDFTYFCEQYITLKSFQHGVVSQVPFQLYPFQKKLFEHWEENQFSINSKYRCGGFTTLAVIYGLWKCLFHIDQQVMYLAKSDRSAIEDGGQIVETALAFLPEWMKGLSMKNNHMKKFDTGSIMKFCTPHSACGQAMGLLIVDEASFIKDIEWHWQAMWPILSTGRCIVQSTPNLDDDWFWERLIDARAGVGIFKEFKCHYTDKLEFARAAWETEMKANLGLSGWNCEVLQIPKKSQQPEIIQPPQPKKWRNIFDDWQSSYTNAEASAGD